MRTCITFKSMCWFSYCCTVFVLNFDFLVSLYKELLGIFPKRVWETFSACFIDLDNLCEVFGYSIKADFMLTLFEFSKFLSC